MLYWSWDGAVFVLIFVSHTNEIQMADDVVSGAARELIEEYPESSGSGSSAVSPRLDRVRDMLLSGVKSLTRPLKSYEVETLRPIHKQIIALSAAGAKNREIADMLDVAEAWVSQILRHPEAQALRNEMVADFVTQLHGDARELISAHTKEAILTVVGLMRSSPKDNIRLLAAKDILDRGGFKPQERIVSTNINLSADDAAAIKAALSETREVVPELHETEVTSSVFAEARERGE